MTPDAKLFMDGLAGGQPQSVELTGTRSIFHLDPDRFIAPDRPDRLSEGPCSGMQW